MIRVFLDASVLFSASYSAIGSSYINLKDSPIITTAGKANLDYLVICDKTVC